jgi:tetratricopeptide (TPR) repeat protein/uncharacterized RDD family membrane protein YckC
MQKQKIDDKQINLVAGEEHIEIVTGTAEPDKTTAKPDGTSEPNGLPEANGTPGEVIAGRYELVNLIGSGGMGKVYKAVDRLSGAQVALKLITPERLQNPEALKRFSQEATAAARLSHPNIVNLREFAQDSAGLSYLVMDYIEGITLQELLQNESAVSPDRALKILEQVCAGLKQAHERGIVHRDLKPANIILERSSDGRDHVKILDFGIAGIQGETGSAHVPLTETGKMLGTPWYMSPEQCFGQPADCRTDIYQLGCLFYELLAGGKPFEGSTAFDIMFKHVTADPGIDKLPADVSVVVERALKKNPLERYQNVDEMLADIVAAGSAYTGAGEADQEKLQDRSPAMRPEDAPARVVPRRLAAAALDALALGTIFVLIIVSMNAAGFMCKHNEWGLPYTFTSVVSGFFLAVFDSLLVWPSMLLSLFPDHHWLSELASRSVPYSADLSNLIYECQAVPYLLCLLNWLYHSLFECSRLGATPGKIIFGIGVRTGIAQNPSFARATLRHFAGAISMLFVPEIIRFLKGLAKNGPGSIKTQTTKQLRTPIHDALARCTIAASTSRFRSAVVGVLAAIACVLSVPASPWVATAMKNYDLALLIDGNFVPAREERASKYLKEGKPEEAQADLNMLQSTHPEEAEVYVKKAVAFYQKHDLKAACDVLQEGLKNCKKNDEFGPDELRVCLARILATSEGNWKAASELAGHDQGFSRFGTARLFRAFLSEKLGNTGEARNLFRNAEEFYSSQVSLSSGRPDQHLYPEHHLNLAIAQSALGKTDTALSSCNNAMRDCDCVQADSPSAGQMQRTNYIRASAYLLQGELEKKALLADNSRRSLEQAVQLFSGYISSRSAASDNLVDIQTLGKAYLGRARAYDQLGKQDLAALDRAAAGKLGVLFDYGCDDESFYW